MNRSSRSARAVWPATYCLSIDNQILADALCSRATSAWAITTLSPFVWALSLQASQRSNASLQQRIAPKSPTPTQVDIGGEKLREDFSIMFHWNWFWKHRVALNVLDVLGSKLGFFLPVEKHK